MGTKAETYLGDSVYGGLDSFGRLFICTNNGGDDENVIVLETEVYAALLRYGGIPEWAALSDAAQRERDRTQALKKDYEDTAQELHKCQRDRDAWKARAEQAEARAVPPERFHELLETEALMKLVVRCPRCDLCQHHFEVLRAALAKEETK